MKKYVLYLYLCFMPCILSAQGNNPERFISDCISILKNLLNENHYENENEKKFIEGQIEGYEHSLIIIKYFENDYPTRTAVSNP